MDSVFVDFSLYRHGNVVSATLYPEVRGRVRAGTLLRVTGGDVPERIGSVTSISPDGRTVDLELLDTTA